MKKALFVFAFAAAMSAAPLPFFSEIVSWKGMEMGAPQNPKWLKAWRAKGDERALRKKFDAEPGSTIIVGVGRDGSLEGARTAAQLDAQGRLAQNENGAKTEKAAAKTSGAQNAAAKAAQNVAAARLEFLGEYWEEDDQSGFTVWSVYER